MAIKVRCEGCETVLKVPDEAAGKSVKCRQCGGRVKVPSAQSVPSSGARRKKTEQSASVDPDDVFAGLDLERAEDTKKKICPGCARPVREEDIECPKCGVTIATGALSEKQRIRIERRGPPPEEFYANVWGDSWKFLKKHWRFGVQTALVWTVCMSMSFTCLYSWGYYLRSRTAALNEMITGGQGGITVEGNRVVIKVPESGGNVTYDGTVYTNKGQTYYRPLPPEQAMWEPPSLFWLGMFAVFQLGFGGWAWTLATTIAGVTMAGEKRVKRFTLDFFANLTMGFRFYAWPAVLMLPVLLIPAVIAYFNVTAGAIASAVIQLFPLLVLPAAVVHMSQKYTHRAWLLYWMVRDFIRTAAPSLYIFGMNLVLVFLIPVGVFIGIGVTWQNTSGYLMTQQASALEWLKSNVMDMGTGNLQFLFYEMPIVFTSCFIFYLILFSLMSFPAVFMMRVVGLYGVYFRADLSIVNEFPDLEPVGFGPRFLAYLVDSIIITLLGGVGRFIGVLFGLLFNFYGWSIADQLALGVSAVASLGLIGFYFAAGESGAARATLGKWSIGMIVLRDDDKVQTRQQALGRAASALVTALTFYIGFIICAFRPDRKALHDILSKSKVVWQPEQT